MIGATDLASVQERETTLHAARLVVVAAATVAFSFILLEGFCLRHLHTDESIVQGNGELDDL
jgi:hypothetical protein